MPITPQLAQQAQNAIAMPLLITIIAALFWRAVLRVMLAALVAFTLVLLGFGAVMLIQVMHA